MKNKVSKLSLSLISLLVFLFAFTFLAHGSNDPVKLSIISANVSGLPAFLTKYDRNVAKTQQTLGKMLNESGYDIICVQEDFQYHDFLASEMKNYPYQTYTTGSVVVGDGLNIFSKYQIYNVERITWKDYNGIFTDGADGLTPKGFIKCTVDMDGIFIDLYNLHCDSYRTEGDQRVKKSQLIQLAEYLKENSEGRPIIITGDTNLTFHNDPLAEMYRILIEENEFADAWVEMKNGGNYLQGEDAPAIIDDWYQKFGGHDWGRWDSVERVLYKNGDGLEITPTNFEYKIYSNDSNNVKALTDHRIMECIVEIDISDYQKPDNVILKSEKQPSFFKKVFHSTKMLFRFSLILMSGICQLLIDFIAKNVLITIVIGISTICIIYLIHKKRR